MQLGYHSVYNSVSNPYYVTNNITLNGGAVWANDGYQHLTGTITVTNGGGASGSTYNGATGSMNKGLYLEGIVSGSGPLTIVPAAGREVNGYNDGASNPWNTSLVTFTNTANTYSGAITVTGNSAVGHSCYLGVNAPTALQYATAIVARALATPTIRQ